MRALNCEQPAALKECASINQFTNFFFIHSSEKRNTLKGFRPIIRLDSVKIDFL